MTRQCMYLLAYCVFFYSTLRPVLQWSTTVNETIVRTNTRDSISRVSRMTRAVERSFCVGAVGISMAVVKSDRTLRDILEREIIIFSTVLDCLGPINRLASHVFFLAPEGWLKNCKPWSIQTYQVFEHEKSQRKNETWLLASTKKPFFDTTGHADFSDVKGETSLSCYLGTCSKPITTVIPF